MSNKNDNQIIDYKEVFKNEKIIDVKAKQSKLAYIFVLIIYGIFVLSNLLATASNLKNPTEALSVVLNKTTESYLIIYNENEYNLNKKNLEDLKFIEVLVDDINYYLISSDASLPIEELDLKAVLDGTIDSWSDGTAIKIIYDSSQDIAKYATENKALINILNFYDYGQLALSNLLIFTVLLVVIGALLFSDLKSDSLIFFKDKEYNGTQRLISSVIPMFLVTMGAGLVTNLLSMALGFSNNSQNQQQIEMMFASNAKFLMLINVVILAPVIEELVFRKGIFSLFKNKKYAMIASSIIFTLIHLTTESIGLFYGGFEFIKIIKLLILIIPYASMAIFLSYIYKENEENITFVILLHALVNAISGIGILLS